MTNILITGGAGFIGSNVANKLVNKGYKVTVLDILSPQIHGNNPENSDLFKTLDPKVVFIKGDVTDIEDVKKAVEGQDVILHLAAETGTGQSMYEIERYVKTNIGGTALILDYIANNKTRVKKIVVAESRAVYGEGKYNCPNCEVVYPLARDVETMEHGDFDCKCPKCHGSVTLIPTTEDSAIHPTSIYGLTKRVQGELIHLACKSIGIESVSLRYQNVYGPGQSLKNPYTGILSIFSTLIRNGQGINIFEDGKESRDFVYIDDVSDATIRAIETDGISGMCFNVGSGNPTTVMEVAETLNKEYGRNVPLTISGNFRIGDIRHNIADISLAEDKLEFRPAWPFNKGIRQFCSWVKTQEVEKSKYSESLQEMKEKGLMK